jgi:histidyl-tRNA synthetase
VKHLRWRHKVAEKIQAIRGMNDVLPEKSPRWQHIEKIFAQCLTHYGYQEIRFPLVESTHLFKRTIGEITDIVEKEMYTFIDLNGDSLTLRPEGTAGCVRACLEHGLLYNQQQKLWYLGPMFRHEKPQKGRYRQFYQFGVEAFGMSSYTSELELLAICRRLWDALGLKQAISLQINTLGDLNERQDYKKKLYQFLSSHQEKLDSDSLRRLEKNPLRILDSKNKDIQTLLKQGPKLIDCLTRSSRERFERLCNGLEQMNIAFEINPYLVRGLDYYVFEWVTNQLGSQATICAGGRYDALVKQLGGTMIPAAGFAIGLERLLLLQDLMALPPSTPKVPTLFIIASSTNGQQQSLLLAEQLHNLNQGWRVLVDTFGGSFKSQFKKADKSGADFAIILGDDELKTNHVSVKNLRNKELQVSIPAANLHSYLQRYLGDQ